MLALLLAAPAAGIARVSSQAPSTDRIATLSPVAALPAHIAGSFEELTSCQQAPDGEYFIFDRRAHSVFVAPPGLDTARKLIEIGAEQGRVLDPTAFDLAPDGTFVVADAPGGNPRVQIFLASGSTLRGFRLPGRPVARVTLRNLVLNGLAAIEYTGRSIFISQPENGAVITEYAVDGQPRRSFGDLRRTGHENDLNVHLALNSGLVVSNPAGGFYFVFLSGVPQFRKYDENGRLVFERHIEDAELESIRADAAHHVEASEDRGRRDSSGAPVGARRRRRPARQPVDFHGGGRDVRLRRQRGEAAGGAVPCGRNTGADRDVLHCRRAVARDTGVLRLPGIAIGGGED